ncbi:PIN domain-containing protein [Pedobacter frigidisoli]|uniref:PIN domain-containing protein n=1 Tax=Pedobacter frigidisoli TaxID=2530455 RepID=UPI00293066BF|nr:PIN domain-containing protein [Pedobacter frigidisoli]
MPKVTIKNIALDTSFIEGQNFLAGNILYNIADLGKKGIANIYITDIVYREVLARFSTRILEENNKINSVRKTIHGSLRVLKNFADYKEYFTLPEINLETIRQDFKGRFDKWIDEANVIIIDTEDMAIGRIFNDYFENNPPFGSGEKKHEFPDAFSFLALGDHFKKFDMKCYFVSHDKDFDKIKNPHIIPVKDITDKIDILLRLEQEQLADILKLIDNAFIKEKVKLQKEASELINSFLENSVSNRGGINGMEIDVVEKIDLSDVEFTEYNITFIGKDSARIECLGNFAYEIIIAVEDNTEAFYDKEDDIYFGTKHRSIKIKDSRDEHFSVVLDFDLDEDYIEAEVDDINDGNGFDVFEKYDNDYR